MTSRPERFALWAVLLALLALNFGPTFAARNGSGTYTIPNVFSPGDTITSSTHNQNFSDIASELTNSVAADGQTSMTGPLKGALGTVSAPSLTFASDSDTGLYRSSANELSATAGGAQIAKINSSGIDAVSGKVREGGVDLVPVGVVWQYSGSGTTPPSGFLFTFGQCVSQTTYAALYAVVGSTYDNSCSAGEFGIPDIRGRVVAGDDDMGLTSANRLTNQTGGLDGDVLGASGGAETHTLTTAQLSVHDHGDGTLSVASHDHSIPNISSRTFTTAAGSDSSRMSGSNTGGTTFNFSRGNTGNAAPDVTGSTDDAGSGAAHNNVQPTIVLKYIIKY